LYFAVFPTHSALFVLLNKTSSFFNRYFFFIIIVGVN
jgi:hypothetical protein